MYISSNARPIAAVIFSEKFEFVATSLKSPRSRIKASFGPYAALPQVDLRGRDLFLLCSGQSVHFSAMLSKRISREGPGPRST